MLQLRRSQTVARSSSFHRASRWLGCALATGAVGLGGLQAQGQCTSYSISAGPALYIPGSTDISNPNNSDEGFTTVTFPFPVELYGTTYTSGNVSPNGFIEFGGSSPQTYKNEALPTSLVAHPAIFGMWCDLGTGTDGITGQLTSVDGDPGSRTFTIEWRSTEYSYGSTLVLFEIIFHENQSYFDIVYFTTPTTNRATVGVQASGSGPATMYEHIPQTGPGAYSILRGFGETSLRFTCGPTAGVCCDPERNCILAFDANSCQGNAQFVAGTTCTANPCPIPANDACSGAFDLASLSFPGVVSFDNAGAASDATDCTPATQGLWFTYTASQDCVLQCSTVGTRGATWAMAPDCSTTPHCLLGGSNVAIPMTAGQTLKLLAGSASTVPPAPLFLHFNARPAVVDAYAAITPVSTAFIPCTSDTNNHADEAMTAISLPFPVTLYGVSYNSANASSNGFLEFGSSAQSANFERSCLPAASLGPSIFLAWQNMTTISGSGKGIFTSVGGSAPNRMFAIEWRAGFPDELQPSLPVEVDCEAIFYESQPYFDVVYALTPSMTTGVAGVQASSTGPATTYECRAAVLASASDVGGGLALRYTTASVAGACCDTFGACTTQVSPASCPSPSQFTVGVACTPTVCPAPANDACANAISLNSHVYGTTNSASNPVMANLLTPYKVTEYLGNALTESASCPIFHGVWFTYTAPTQSVLLLNQASGGGTSSIVWAMSATCGQTPQCLTPSTGTSIKVPLSAGQTVYLLAGTSTASIDPSVPLTFTFALLPDECATALPLTPPVTAFGWLLHATATSGGVSTACNNPNARDLWYAIRVTRPGTYTITGIAGTGFTLSTPALDLFDSCGLGTTIACGIRTGSTNPVLSVNLTPGTYALRASAAQANGSIRVDVAGPPCLVDFDMSGSVGVADIFEFLNAWFAGDIRADFDGVGGLAVADIFAFLNAWFQGC